MLRSFYGFIAGLVMLGISYNLASFIVDCFCILCLLCVCVCVS